MCVSTPSLTYSLSTIPLIQYNYDIHDAVMKDVNVMMHYLLESTVNFSKICRSRHWSLPRVLVPKLV